MHRQRPAWGESRGAACAPQEDMIYSKPLLSSTQVEDPCSLVRSVPPKAPTASGALRPQELTPEKTCSGVSGNNSNDLLADPVRAVLARARALVASERASAAERLRAEEWAGADAGAASKAVAAARARALSATPGAEQHSQPRSMPQPQPAKQRGRPVNRPTPNLEAAATTPDDGVLNRGPRIYSDHPPKKLSPEKNCRSPCLPLAPRRKLLPCHSRTRSLSWASAPQKSSLSSAAAKPLPPGSLLVERLSKKKRLPSGSLQPRSKLLMARLSRNVASARREAAADSSARLAAFDAAADAAAADAAAAAAAYAASDAYAAAATDAATTEDEPEELSPRQSAKLVAQSLGCSFSESLGESLGCCSPGYNEGDTFRPEPPWTPTTPASSTPPLPASAVAELYPSTTPVQWNRRRPTPVITGREALKSISQSSMSTTVAMFLVKEPMVRPTATVRYDRRRPAPMSASVTSSREAFKSSTSAFEDWVTKPLTAPASLSKLHQGPNSPLKLPKIMALSWWGEGEIVFVD